MSTWTTCLKVDMDIHVADGGQDISGQHLNVHVDNNLSMYREELKAKLLKIQEIRNRQQKMPKLILGKLCDICGDTYKLQIHHIKYNPIETITVCNDCHGLIHGKRIVFRHPTITKPIITLEKIPEAIAEKEFWIKHVYRCGQKVCSRCDHTQKFCLKEQIRGEILELQTRSENKR